MAGRKTSSAYELYGFIPKFENGKHSAICTSCNRVLQNTAAVRMQKHRNSCLAARASGNITHYPIIEIKQHVSPKIKKPEPVQQMENIKTNVKMEHNSIEFDDSNVENVYDETIDNLQDYIPSRKYTTKKDIKTDEELKAKIHYFKEKSKYFVSETKNLKIDKTMMVLKIKKLRLEIQQLEQ